MNEQIFDYIKRKTVIRRSDGKLVERIMNNFGLRLIRMEEVIIEDMTGSVSIQIIQGQLDSVGLEAIRRFMDMIEDVDLERLMKEFQIDLFRLNLFKNEVG